MENNIECDLSLLFDLKSELKKRRKVYNDSVKGLKASIYSLEQKITEQVLSEGHTVQVGMIRAEYKPTVVIKIKREQEQNNGE